MPIIQGRGSIVQAAVVVILLWSRAADAQVGNDPGPPAHGGLLGNMVIGAQYDIVNQAKAERRLHHLQAKFGRDAERGSSAAVDRDARRIHSLKNRIAVDEWLIRKNLLLDPGYYPCPLRLDPMSCAAMAQMRRPAFAP